MRLKIVSSIAVLLFSVSCLYGEKIGDYAAIDMWDQLQRFALLEDPAVRIALIGGVLIGWMCGMWGSFLVVRGRSLYGDVISHAVLPGVVMGFIVTMEKNLVYMSIGALAAGLLGTYCMSWIQRRTILKEDTAMGLVLAGFYGVGIGLMTMLQNVPTAQQAGLDKYLFGQIAGLSTEDIVLMALVGLLSVIVMVCCYRNFLWISFDPSNAKSLGIRVWFYDSIMMLMVTLVVVIALKAVGVVLVSGMLIIPGAVGYLLHQKMHRVMLTGIIVGISASILGVFLSFLKHSLPTGALMILSSALLGIVLIVFKKVLQ